MFIVADHALIEKENYISPSANFELLISATTPVVLDEFRGYYEIGGKWQSHLFSIERSFSEGDFEGASHLAANLLCDLDKKDPLLGVAKLYLAKSLARSAYNKTEKQNEAEMALHFFQELEHHGSEEVAVDAGIQYACKNK